MGRRAVECSAAVIFITAVRSLYCGLCMHMCHAAQHLQSITFFEFYIFAGKTENVGIQCIVSINS